MSDSLLIELGCEELPAGEARAMAAHLGHALHAVLAEAGLASAPPAIFSTPRRLAAQWSEVAARQADREVDRRGPAVASAFEDGAFGGTPSRALQGFLKSAGASVEDLSSVETDKGARVVLKQVQPGRTPGDLLADALPDALRSMPMSRRMRWGDGDEEFLRPVVWLLALHGGDILPLRALGLAADRQTYGHRFHAPGPFALADADEYASTLEAAYVQPDADARRARVVEGARAEAARLGGEAVMDDALVNEVTSLVEWPVALAGRFEETFLEVPKEALIQTMQENQRYFALLDGDGTLMNAFVTVANLESKDPAVVIDGNERVIRPRFADTMFFWRQDLGTPLETHRPALDKLLFEKRLGSVGDKATRIESLARTLAPELGADAEAAARAAGLAKCDLVTEIVKELPKMQGIAGHYYALRDGDDPAVARAIEQHWYPKQAGAALPDDALGATVALADRLDTLVGIFGIGGRPVGAKDPFGLRRAGIAVVRLLVEGGHALSLDEAITASRATFAPGALADGNEAELRDFLLDRLRTHLVERDGRPVDAVDAVLGKRLDDPADIAARLTAIEGFRTSDAAGSLAQASKRIGNLLRKSAADEGDGDVPVSSAAPEPAEAALIEAIDGARPGIEAALATRDYRAAMARTAALARPVDRFFDEVLVMVDDAALRRRRLRLLADLGALCDRTADLSLLQPGDVAASSAGTPAGTPA